MIFILTIIIISLLSGCGKNYHLKVHIIDVGQGDSILIQTPNGDNILVDGGTNDSEYIINNYLKRNKVNSIDYLIATHPDSDHIGGLDFIISNFQIKNVYMPMQTRDSKAYNDLINACNKKDLNIKYLSKGDTLTIEESLYLNVLSPSFIQEDSNLNSIVFNLNYKNKSFLFTGDAELSNELDIVNSFELEDVDFLKVGHHGSDSSTSIELLEETTPDVAVISCGYKNSYGHPHASTLNNLNSNNIKTYRTDLSGDLVFYSDGNIIYTKKHYKTNDTSQSN